MTEQRDENRAEVRVNGVPAVVEYVKTYTRVDRDSGSLMTFDVYRVQFEGRSPHLVRVEVGHSGTPYRESCDCKGYRFRGDCRHITAVYESGLLACDPEW